MEKTLALLNPYSLFLSAKIIKASAKKTVRWYDILEANPNIDFKVQERLGTPSVH